MLFLACLAVFLFVYLLSWQYLKPKEVSIREEWSIKHSEGTSLTNMITILICGLACALVAYGVTGETFFAVLGFFGGYFVAKQHQIQRPSIILFTILFPTRTAATQNSSTITPPAVVNSGAVYSGEITRETPIRINGRKLNNVAVVRTWAVTADIYFLSDSLSRITSAR